VVPIIRRTRNLTTAVFGVFAAAAAVAQAAGAAPWLGIALAVVAGVGAFAAVGLVWLEHIAEREQDAAERLRGALELLGEASVRQGGIYLLEGVARDAPTKYQGPMVEVLTSYIRGNAPWPPRAAGTAVSPIPAKHRPAPDVQAALSVLGRRDPNHDDPRIELRLSDVDLRGASFRRGHFEGIRLRRSNLEDAQFEGAHLQGAKLRDANLRGADLGPDRELRLGGANLHHANLSGANFEGAKLKGARLTGATFDGDTRWPDGFDAERAGCLRRS
jgi:hypothetical protein